MNLKTPFILAPMAKYSDIAFRILCRKYGASLCYTEQISAIALKNESKKTLEMIKTSQEDHPISLQLSGRDKEILLEVIKKHEKNYDYIDLNFGCPSKKIVKCGYGSALLQEKEYVKELLEYLSSNMKKPLTIKMRSGFKKDEALSIIKIMEPYVDTIAIHARTREQGYSGKADWEIIKKVKENCSVKIIGNGDVKTPEDAVKMLEYTKCDYVMIARASLGNPLLFKQCNDFYDEGKYETYSLEDRKKAFYELIKLIEKYELNNLFLIKSHALDFFKGYKNSRELKNKVSLSKNKEEVMDVIEKFYKN